MFDRLGEMFQNVTIGGVIIVVVIIAAIVLTAMFIAKKRAKKNRRPPVASRRVQNVSIATKQPEKSTDVSTTLEQTRDTVSDVEEEEGEPAYIIRLDGSLDFDTIPEAMGDVFTAEPSMPKSGACYFVKEIEVGKYEAYDPRTAPLASELTPVTAWFATHWDIVRQVFAVPAPWWKSTSLWIAGIAGLLAFIVALATIGG